MAFCPRAAVTKNYQTQPSALRKTTSLSSFRPIIGNTQTTIPATPIFNRKPATFNETPKISNEPAEADATKPETWGTPYPKILQDGAVENFRPQEVHEKVTYAEPLSPPNEQESYTIAASGASENEEDQRGDDDETPEETVVESVITNQAEVGLSSEPPFKDEVIHHQFTTPNLTPYHAKNANLFLDESDSDMPIEGPAEKDGVHQPHASVEAWGSTESIGKAAERVQEESDSETEAMLEPTFESRTSSPMSECENAEAEFNQSADFSREENNSNGDAGEIIQKVDSYVVGTNQTDVEDKLYPDGEEMDTWDSVIERKVDLKTDDGIKDDEVERQHAEPEEDISAREPEHEKTEDFVASAQAEDYLVMNTKAEDDGHPAALYQENAPLPGKEEEEEEEDGDEEDSQNVCVSWRTELESDSYAQDNTLADTRPLIRYKSDETDANTQASHMEESESSEGDQEKKMVEMESGQWSEEQSKKFGTMEDLCEEAEGEVLDEEYDLGYADTEDREAAREHVTSLKDTEGVEEMINKDSDGYSDEEAEELIKPTVATNVGYEEMEIDRLVEQELENLSTESYSAHFAQQQTAESEELLEEEDGQTSPSAESGHVEDRNFEYPDTIRDEPAENICSIDSSAVMPQTHTLTDEIEQEDRPASSQDKRQEVVEQNVSMVTHADVTEDNDSFSDFISRPETVDFDNSEKPDSASQENLQVADEVEDAAPVEETDPQEHPGEDAAPGAGEWEVPENPSEDFQIRHDHKHDEGPESYLHDDGGSDEGVMMCKEEAHEISPDSVPDQHDIFAVKDSTESVDKNSQDNTLHGVFSSSFKSDFWVSSLETGATYQPDDARNEAAEQTNQDLGFGENLFWGDSENPKAINGNSRVDIDSSKAMATKEEQGQMRSEVKQLLSRNVVEGELVHSEESDAEGEFWSSGEETVEEEVLGESI